MQLNKQIKNTLRQKKQNKTKKLWRRSRLVINHLTTMNDQNRISPHNIFTTSSTQVMRKR